MYSCIEDIPKLVSIEHLPRLTAYKYTSIMKDTVGIKIDPIKPKDKPWITSLLKESWRSTKVVTRGVVYDASLLPGFIARIKSEPKGLITYHFEGQECEIVTLNSLLEKTGIGSTLITAVLKLAESHSCRRLWLITTNDNINAIHFYLGCGFRIARVHRNVIENSRRMKPEISRFGFNGTPILHEIEMEYLL
jgi:GNAT superfamily N-acetyltransferase